LASNNDGNDYIDIYYRLTVSNVKLTHVGVLVYRHACKVPNIFQF